MILAVSPAIQGSPRNRVEVRSDDYFNQRVMGNSRQQMSARNGTEFTGPSTRDRHTDVLCWVLIVSVTER